MHRQLYECRAVSIHVLATFSSFHSQNFNFGDVRKGLVNDNVTATDPDDGCDVLTLSEAIVSWIVGKEFEQC